jgi:hypothetical protein
LGLVEPVAGIAQLPGQPLDGRTGPDDDQDVAVLEIEIRPGGELLAGPDDARDEHPVVVAQVELVDGLADDVAAGDDDPPAGEAGSDLPDVDRALDAHAGHEPFDLLGRAHGVEDVAQPEGGERPGDFRGPAGVGQSRDDHPSPDLADDPADGFPVDLRVADLEVDPLETRHVLLLQGLELAGLGSGIDPEGEAQGGDGQDDAQDAEGVGHGVSHAGHLDEGFRGVGHELESLLDGGQAGGVARGPGEDARGGGHGHSSDPAEQESDGPAAKNDEAGQGVEGQPVLAERGEEPGPHLLADAVDEEDEPEVAGEILDDGMDGDPEMPEDQSDEQDAGDAQVGLKDAQAAQDHSQGAGQAQDEQGLNDGIRRESLGDPAHRSGLPVT